MFRLLNSKWLMMIIGFTAGGVLFGSFCLAKYAHHHRDIEEFFHGRTGDLEVVGISYFDYHGFVFMEPNRWRVELRRKDGSPQIIYSRQGIFQESVPHQPDIKIIQNVVHIDDGEFKLQVSVEHTPIRFGER